MTASAVILSMLLGDGAGDPHQSQVHRPRGRPHDADHAVPRDAGRDRPAVQDDDLRPDLRAAGLGPRRRSACTRSTGSAPTRLPSVVVVLVWEWTPFMMLIVLAGLQSESLEALEAARVDGANAFQTFVCDHVPAPAPLHRARAAARLDLHRPGLRRDLHPHRRRRRQRHRDDEPSVLHLRAGRSTRSTSREAAAAGVIVVIAHGDRRDDHAAPAVRAVHGVGGDGLTWPQGLDATPPVTSAARASGRWGSSGPTVTWLVALDPVLPGVLDGPHRVQAGGQRVHGSAEDRLPPDAHRVLAGVLDRERRRRSGRRSSIRCS